MEGPMEEDVEEADEDMDMGEMPFIRDVVPQ